jgi:hypothetical protein
MDGGEGSIHVHTVLSKLFNKHPKLLAGVVADIGDTHQAFKEAYAGVEAEVCGDLQDHLDSIAGPLYALLNLTETGYQKLINSLSWKYDHEQGRHRRIRFKWGTRMPRLMSQIAMRAAKQRFMRSIGIVRGRNQAYVDAAIVLIRRIRVLVQQGLLVLTPGLKLRVQILGDATGIWPSLKVNGTTIILKVMYEAPHGTKTEGAGVNSKANMLPIGFYLGDDCLKEMQEFMSHLPDMLKKIQSEGLDIDGDHVDIEFWIGGDLKFVTGILGMSGNQTVNPCPFCNVEDSKGQREMHLSKEELDVKGVEARTIDDIQMYAHIHNGEDYDCPRCNEHITEGIEYPVRSTYHRRAHQREHLMVVEGKGPFFPFIPVSRVLVDILHLELRICPAIWRLTVSNHVSKDELEKLCQWVYDEHKIIISKDTAVQSSTGKENKIGSSAWPGKTCSKIMQIYPQVMEKVHVKKKKRNLALCTLCWDYFVLLMTTLKKGCNDDDADSVENHAQEVEALSENMLKAFIEAGLAMDRVTVYMHIAIAHLPEQIRLIGSLSKGSSQGAERMHQDMQCITKYHTNKQPDTVCGTTLEKVHSKLDAMQNKNFEKRRGKAHVKLMLPGGHLSKADRLLRDATYHQAEVKLGDKAFRKAVIEKDIDGDDSEVTDDHLNADGWSSTSSSEDADSDANEEESNASDNS